jgi:hypothetical protein
MNWFSRTTSTAGMQVSNWILAIVVVVVRTLDDLLSIHSLKHAADSSADQGGDCGSIRAVQSTIGAAPAGRM